MKLHSSRRRRCRGPAFLLLAALTLVAHGAGAAPAPASLRLPPLPDACNLTVAGEPAAPVEASFEGTNSACVAAFATCADPTTTGNANASCTGSCNANVDLLRTACYGGGSVFCAITLINPPGSPVWAPAASFVTEQCLPSTSCGPDQAGTIADYWQSTLCGPADPASPAVAACRGAVVVSCDYDLSSSAITTIVLSCVGSVAAVAAVLGGCHFYYRRKDGGDDEDEESYVEAGVSFDEGSGGVDAAAQLPRRAPIPMVTLVLPPAGSTDMFVAAELEQHGDEADGVQLLPRGGGGGGGGEGDGRRGGGGYDSER